MSMTYPEYNMTTETGKKREILDFREGYQRAKEKAMAAIDRTVGRSLPIAAVMEFKGVTVKIDELFEQSEVKKVVISFLEIQSIFSEEIEGIYFVPNKFISKESKFHDRVNLVVKIKGLHLLSYLSSSKRENKSLLDYWNDKKTDKDRFWPVRTTKLVLTLNQIHAGSQILSVWVQGYSSICSAEMFSSPSDMVQMSPGEMFKLVR